jgi:hypothetical protein
VEEVHKPIGLPNVHYDPNIESSIHVRSCRGVEETKAVEEGANDRGSCEASGVVLVEEDLELSVADLDDYVISQDISLCH